jgi:hypothetical protein
MILTAATAFPDMSGETILIVLGGGVAVGIAGFAVVTLLRQSRREPTAVGDTLPPDRLRVLRATWRMPALEALPAPQLSLSKRLWIAVLRAYLVAAVALVAVKVVQVAAGQ